MRIHEIVMISEIYLKLILLYRHNILYYCLLDLDPKIPTRLKKRLYGTSADNYIASGHNRLFH